VSISDGAIASNSVSWGEPASWIIGLSTVTPPDTTDGAGPLGATQNTDIRMAETPSIFNAAGG
jgi:hypothetical protein